MKGNAECGVRNEDVMDLKRTLTVFGSRPVAAQLIPKVSLPGFDLFEPWLTRYHEDWLAGKLAGIQGRSEIFSALARLATRADDVSFEDVWFLEYPDKADCLDAIHEVLREKYHPASAVRESYGGEDRDPEAMLPAAWPEKGSHYVLITRWLVLFCGYDPDDNDHYLVPIENDEISDNFGTPRLYGKL